MIIKITGLTTKSISTDLGNITLGKVVSASLPPDQVFQVSKNLTPFIEAGYVSVEISEDPTIDDTMEQLVGGGSAAGTSGAVQFSDGANGLTSDATNFFWNNTSKRLGLGTASPSTQLHVAGTMTSGVASGQNALTVSTAGARIHVAGGTANYIDSGGSNDIRMGGGSFSHNTATGLTSIAGATIIPMPTAGASDVAIKAGTSVADASVTTGFKALSICAGIGATEVEHLNISTKPTATLGVLHFPNPMVNVPAISIVGGAGLGLGGMVSWSGGGILFGEFNGQELHLGSTNRGIRAFANAAGFLTAGQPHIWFQSGSAGSRTQVRFDGNQAGATDVCVEAGTTVADGSVNAGARLLTVKTGLDGTPIEKFYVGVAGTYTTPGTTAAPGFAFIGDTGTGLRRSAAGTIRAVSAGQDVAAFDTSAGISGLLNTTYAFYIPGSAAGIQSANSFRISSELADGASSVACVINSINAYSTSGAKLLSVKNATVEKAYIDKDGLLNSVATQLTSLISGTGVTANYHGDHRRASLKVTIAYNAWTDADMDQTLTLATIPAKCRIVSVIADTTTKYDDGSGGVSLTAANLEVGISGDTDAYIATHDVYAAPVTKGLLDADLGASMARAAAVQGGHIPSWTATDTLVARLTTVGANINTLTTGSTTYHITYELM